MVRQALSKPAVLYVAAALLLLVSLGSKPLWGQEGRWGVICREMMTGHDYLHPVLLGESYEDKPLGSYWLMIGASRLFGGLSEWTLRLPSALSGVLAVFCLVRIGTVLLGREAGLLAGWILTTMFFFVFWARVSSADMLNVAAVTGGIAWYFERRTRPGVVAHAVFGAVLAAGALMKGLVAPVLTLIAVAPDLFSEGRWRSHLKWTLLPAAAAFALVYGFPFALSSSTGESHGLRMVFQENFLRYFKSFDHQETWYFYLYQFPLYLLPWAPLALASFFRLREWKQLPKESRWAFQAALLCFLFLEGSGSRRNYYLLPLLPMVSLILADWLRARGEEGPRMTAARWLIVGSAVPMALWFGGIQPYLATVGGSWVFRDEVRREAERTAPWESWELLPCSAPPDAAYYLGTPGHEARRTTTDELDAVAAFLKAHPRTIVVTYGRFQKTLEPLLSGPVVVAQKPMFPSWLKRFAPQSPNLVALIQTARGP
jgi:4-amino-4-deoxy-L-arabinose transferase-like glycosyltransferase